MGASHFITSALFLSIAGVDIASIASHFIAYQYQNESYQIGSSITLLEKYLLHIHSHNHFQNAIIFSSKIACSIKNGLNLALLLILLKHKMRFISNNPIGVGIICEGRIASTKGYMTTNMNVSSVGSFSNRIIDIAIIESISALGKLSVKLGVII